MKIEIKEKIKSIIAEGKYEVYGLRVEEKKYKVGEICEKSHNWWQDDPEDGSEYNDYMRCWDGGELNGTCAIEITEENIDKALENVDIYYGDYLHLIAGNYCEGGNDIGEVIIPNAIVLAEFEN